MSTNDNVIDPDKLENVRHLGDGSFKARCPMCQSMGNDRTGDHLRVWLNGAFNCAPFKGDKEHNAGILALAGTKGSGNVVYIQPEPQPEVETIYPDDCLARLVRDFTYWRKRGLSDETMDQFEGGIALTGKMKNRYVFPMRDQNGRIHGFTGRYILPISADFKVVRWKHLNASDQFVFNRAAVTKAIKQTGVAVLVEGPGCPLALAEVGIKEVLPAFGINPSSSLLSFLIPLKPRKIVISLNNEPDNHKATLKGNEAAEKVRQKLLHFFNEETVTIRLPKAKDWLDDTMDERKRFKEELYA